MYENTPRVDRLQLINPSWFLSDDTVELAQQLVGQFLIYNTNGNIRGGRIVETEAYKAPEDKACHAHLNRYTKRTRVMFEKGGRTYVYLCYGIHHLLNIVTGPEGEAHAILIRALEPIWGLDFQSQNRPKQPQSQWTNGPGKLSKALGVTLQDNNRTINTDTSSILLCKNPKNTAKIAAAPRIGIGYAGECEHWPWRFLDSNSKFVSVPAPGS
jgi:DNA-3-methyladenine glycosylase